MFQRRNSVPLLHRVRGLFWPEMGFRRLYRYFGHRISRLPGTPYSIAAGFACGAAVSFTPFVGLHFVLSAVLAWAIGANIVASLIGTAIGNPWTFPLIWVWIYTLGAWILGLDSAALPGEITLAYVFENPARILLPMLVGSVPTGTAVWLVIYWPLSRAVRRYQRRRRARMAAARIEASADSGVPSRAVSRRDKEPAP